MIAQCSLLYFFQRFINVITIFSRAVSFASHLFLSSISVPFRLILRRHTLIHLPSYLPFLLFFSSFLASLHRFMCHIETRRTKETVTPQLAKLLMYSLFNQINERVDAHFYAPVQLFMVYGNCPKRTRVHRSRGRDRGLTAPCEARLPDALSPFAELRSRAPFLRPLSLSSRPLAHPLLRFPLPRLTSQSGLTTV